MLAAVASIACLASLASGSPAGSPRRDALVVDIGGQHFELADGKLRVREVGGFGPHQGQLLRSETLTPDAASWSGFWQELEQLGVFGWTATYRSAATSNMDGVRWSVQLSHAGKTVAALGYNAYPEGWTRFVVALEKLAAPKPGR